MRTNGANEHQHKVFEKRLAPDIFTTRIDLELCACGARRWVDQDGTPATPWRFINLGTSPIRKEDARVAPRTSPKSALEGLIACGNCGKPMLRDGTQHDKEAHYVCQPGPGNRWAQCQTPRLHARRSRGPAGPHGAADSPDRGEHLQGAGGGKRPPAVRRST